MTLVPRIKCDVCKEEILADAQPHQTRQVYSRLLGKDEFGDDVFEDLKRRDLCDGCVVRIGQAILGPLKGCEWLLDGFKVARK